jgi:REP element-mobilizing transposase RayT
MEKYNNKYRIPSNRLQGYDYGSNGCYFVTICTKNREHYFGEIVVETDNYPSLRKTSIGEIAEKFWLDIPNHFPFVILDQFVIMPNHIHGILILHGKTVITTALYAMLTNLKSYVNSFSISPRIGRTMICFDVKFPIENNFKNEKHFHNKR